MHNFDDSKVLFRVVYVLFFIKCRNIPKILDRYLLRQAQSGDSGRAELEILVFRLAGSAGRLAEFALDMFGHPWLFTSSVRRLSRKTVDKTKTGRITRQKQPSWATVAFEAENLVALGKDSLMGRHTS